MKCPILTGNFFVLNVKKEIAAFVLLTYRASRVSLDTIQKTLKQMDSSIRNLQTDITNNRVPQGDDDKFLDVMETFAEEAREQCDVLQNMCKKMDTLYTDLSEYYVFDKQKYTLEEFFTDLKTFKDHFVVRFSTNNCKC